MTVTVAALLDVGGDGACADAAHRAGAAGSAGRRKCPVYREPALAAAQRGIIL